MSTSEEFEGRVAVIAGAGAGVGRATALLLASRGASVVALDLDGRRATETVDACSATGARCLAIEVDQRVSADVSAAAQQVLAQFGRVDVLANIAGIPMNRRIVDSSDDEWLDVLDVNLNGPFYLSRAFLPSMLARRSGAIISVASGQAHAPGLGFAAYAASKGGLVAFNRVLALEASPYVRANVVSPGPINTQMFRDLPPELAEPILAATPLGRTAEPEELAEAIAFLASDRSAFTTGQVLHVNGGRVMP